MQDPLRLTDCHPSAAPFGRPMSGGEAGAVLTLGVFVLLSLALILIGAMRMIGPKIDLANTAQTNMAMDQIEQALAVFAARNARLPCPALGSLSSASATYGQEAVTAGTPATCTATASQSVVPWVTLGLDERVSLDGWNHRIAYIPAGGQTGTGWNSLVDGGTDGKPGPGCLYDNLPANPTRPSYCGATGSGDPTGNYIAVYQAANPGAEITSNVPAGSRAAYVLLSHGKSGVYGWTKGGVQLGDPGIGYTLKAENNSGTAGSGGAFGYLQGAPIGTASSTGYFDDILRFRAPSALIQLCGNVCGSPSKTISAGTQYSSGSATSAISSPTAAQLAISTNADGSISSYFNGSAQTPVPSGGTAMITYTTITYEVIITGSSSSGSAVLCYDRTNDVIGIVHNSACNGIQAGDSLTISSNLSGTYVAFSTYLYSYVPSSVIVTENSASPCSPAAGPPTITCTASFPTPVTTPAGYLEMAPYQSETETSITDNVTTNITVPFTSLTFSVSASDSTSQVGLSSVTITP